ncbi:hypothetical protein RHMOL_Rhmol01G0126400 [Rhododendron molle]|uniref:Uncharacterized protein n=1 Tax=Rhododendron molle TaxID=49168 RepID=A0ACC0Q437_RHOML|nr:hypothetical protein RHMOL_Rhmol01G0126400 [Rhododendron molle]
MQLFDFREQSVGLRVPINAGVPFRRLGLLYKRGSASLYALPTTIIQISLLSRYIPQNRSSDPCDPFCYWSLTTVRRHPLFNGSRDSRTSHVQLLPASVRDYLPTIRTLRRAVSNLQDFAFDQLDDKHDPECAPERGSDDTVEDSEGNPNGSNDRSDGVNDDSDEGSN